MAPDGLMVVFMSRRPATGTAQRADFDIWTYRFATHESRRIDEVSTDAMEICPSITSNGTLYFTSDRPGGFGKIDIHRSRFVDGRYTAPENIGNAVNTRLRSPTCTWHRTRATSSFCRTGRGGAGRVDVYYSRRTEDGSWSAPRALAGGRWRQHCGG